MGTPLILFLKLCKLSFLLYLITEVVCSNNHQVLEFNKHLGEVSALQALIY